MKLTNHQRTLAVSGVVLFLLGLLQGAAVQNFLNPRMALSAHLTAVQSGIAMMVVGALWEAASLRSAASNLARWTITGGMVGLWIGLTVSAMTGASEALPMAGAGHKAARPVETMVSIIVLGSSVLMTIGWAVYLVGLVRSKQ